MLQSIESQYINILTCRPLSGRFYMDLPVELRSPRKELINIKNKDEKCFFIHINPFKEHPEIILKTDKKIGEKLDYAGIEFLCKKKILTK